MALNPTCLHLDDLTMVIVLQNIAFKKLTSRCFLKVCLVPGRCRTRSIKQDPYWQKSVNPLPSLPSTQFLYFSKQIISQCTELSLHRSMLTIDPVPNRSLELYCVEKKNQLKSWYIFHRIHKLWFVKVKQI